MWFIYHSCRCFSLSFSISKQEEWELLFCYVLQYPLVVKEAGSLEKSGIGVHVEVGIKKVKHNTLVALVMVISRVYPLLQICLFLIKLSHAFSSYYSRVKILMVGVCLCICPVHSSVYLQCLSVPQAAEPHLVPLVHARLHLMAAIKQTMYNALSLLAIEPLEQLWITSWK